MLGKTAPLAALIITALPATAQDAALEPQVASYLEANRRSLVLLGRGERQLTFSTGFTMSGNDYGIGTTGKTELSTGVGFAYGITDRMEVFGELPFKWERAEEAFLGVVESESRRYATGTAGLRMVLAFEGDRTPEVIGAISGSYPFGDALGITPDLRFGLSAHKLIDPVLLSAGAGVSLGLKTGETKIDFMAGADIALSDRFGLGIDVSWVSDGSGFASGLNDGVTLTFRGSIASEDGSSSWQPFVAVGATNGASDVILGMSWTRRW